MQLTIVVIVLKSLAGDLSELREIRILKEYYDGSIKKETYCY